MHPAFTLTTDAAGIATLTLNRPERLNTMDGPFYTGLRDAVRALDATGDVRVLVIASTGKHFSAGMDFAAFAELGAVFDTRTARSRAAFQHALADFMGVFDALDRARFPVVCAVQGGCIGAGLDLAAACDIRLCTADAFFCLQETQIGMAADLGVLQRLQRLMPAGAARQMAYTSERLPAERALALGLVNAVLSDADALRAHAMDLAQQIAAKSPLAVAGSKAALNHARDHGTAESLAHMAVLQSAIFDAAELQQSVSAWQSKTAAAYAPLAPLITLQTQPPVRPGAPVAAAAAPAPAPAPAAQRYSAESTVGELLQSEAARAIVERHLPGIGGHPQLGMAKGMSLATVAKFTGGLISAEALAAIDKDLKALS